MSCSPALHSFSAHRLCSAVFSTYGKDFLGAFLSGYDTLRLRRTDWIFPCRRTDRDAPIVGIRAFPKTWAFQGGRFPEWCERRRSLPFFTSWWRFFLSDQRAGQLLSIYGRRMVQGQKSFFPVRFEIIGASWQIAQKTKGKSFFIFFNTILSKL